MEAERIGVHRSGGGEGIFLSLPLGQIELSKAQLLAEETIVLCSAF